MTTANSAKLYMYDTRIGLVITSDNIIVDNRPMYQRTIVAHKGVHNRINFEIRNRDRQLQNVFSDELVAYIIEPKTKRRLVTRQLEATQTVGEAVLELIPGDIQDVAAGRYHIYITRKSPTYLNELPLYANQDNGLRFDIEITDQANITPAPTQEVDEFTETSSGVFVTSSLLGNIYRNYPNAQHSVAIYLSSFTGNVRVQASCVGGSPDTDDASPDWFDVYSESIDQADSGILEHNFQANVNWVRVVFEPAAGTVSKVLVRN